MAFKIGQKVVCVYGFEKEPQYNEILPEINNIYTIRDIEEGDYFRFKEILNKSNDYGDGKYECAFHCSCFKPLDYDFVEEVIKNVTPKEVEI